MNIIKLKLFNIFLELNIFAVIIMLISMCYTFHKYTLLNNVILTAILLV